MFIVFTVLIMFPGWRRRCWEPVRRSPHCTNGREFIVTLADDANGNQMAAALGGRPLWQEPSEGQLKAMAVCFGDGTDIKKQLKMIRRMDGVEAIEENAVVELVRLA